MSETVISLIILVVIIYGGAYWISSCYVKDEPRKELPPSPVWASQYYNVPHDRLTCAYCVYNHEECLIAQDEEEEKKGYLEVKRCSPTCNEVVPHYYSDWWVKEWHNLNHDPSNFKIIKRQRI